MTGPVLLVLGAQQAAWAARLHARAVSAPWSAASIRQILQADTTLALGICAESDAPPVGFAFVQIVAGEADLLMIVTDPDHRRQGLARALLTGVIRRLGERGVARLTLDVAADNHAASRLYEAFGFACDGVRKNYYQQGRAAPVDALCLSLILAMDVSL